MSSDNGTIGEEKETSVHEGLGADVLTAIDDGPAVQGAVTADADRPATEDVMTDVENVLVGPNFTIPCCIR
jgi:hypothetical protein